MRIFRRAFVFQMATNLALDPLRRRKLHCRFLRIKRASASNGERETPS